MLKTSLAGGPGRISKPINRGYGRGSACRYNPNVNRPTVPGGTVATICVVVSLVIVAELLPNMTAVVPARLVPAIVTEAPAVAEVGLTLVTAGLRRWQPPA